MNFAAHMLIICATASMMLRARHGNANYRILYFFHGKDIVVLAHGLTKEDKVPEADIKRAVKRKRALEQNPEQHVYEEDDDDESQENP